MDFILIICDDTTMLMKFVMISWAIYELLPFGFHNVIGFSSPQSLISKQYKDFMKFIYGNGMMMHVKIYKDVIGCRDVIAL